ncbi:acetate--CoA ligase family protein [Roseovarius sp. SK2]|jgi:succinyl-CoA synthetase beta subunit|uniref:succinate--CoA ligase subunit beta n=1 Tax=Roseovarius TaxID=74030 RepID=UPI000CDE298D|nr:MULTISPECIES: ATP-grasp domain-containing protein [Roseovarius]MDD9726951.1 acetate--CoA ligase family protein [Roseovarius sp. SK2]
MLLAEYQSKELLAQYGVSVPPGKMARTPDEAEAACANIPARKFVVKAQITSGARGLAGGIKFAATASAVKDEAARLLGKQLITNQTGATGETVHAVYVEADVKHDAQYYIAFALDPDTGAPLLVASPDGGVEFEQKAQMNASEVAKHSLTGSIDADRAGLTEFLSGIGMEDEKAVEQLLSACEAFIENDMALLEINPFVRTPDGTWMAIDAKVALDASAAFRHPEWDSMVSGEGLPAVETAAQKSNINFVKLTGNLGVVVNGAGLGLATNDMIIDAGGKPANFMDIRTTATSMDIARGVELLLQEPSVTAILLNVHGGGMTVCDTIAEGVNFAYSRNKGTKPVIARLAGQNAEWGQRILVDRKVPVEICGTMSEAVNRAVEIASKGAR